MRGNTKKKNEIVSFVRALSSISEGDRVIFVKYLNDDGLSMVYELIANSLQHPTLSAYKRKRLKQQLKTHSKLLRKLASGKGGNQVSSIAGKPLTHVCKTGLGILKRL